MNATSVGNKGIVLACPGCGQRNRLPYDRLGSQFRCPKCQTPLPHPAAPIDVIDEETFHELVAHSAIPVLVDFWAEWCGPCKMMAPELEKLAAANAGKWLIAKVSTEDHPGLGNAFQIRSIPALVLFNRGEEISRSAGARPARQIQEFVEAALG